MKNKQPLIQVFFVGRDDLNLGGWKVAFKRAGLKIYKVLTPTQLYSIEGMETADIIIVDVEDKGYRYENCEMVRILLKVFTEKKIVAITDYYNAEVEKRARELNASGYIIRSWPDEETISSLLNIAKGEPFFMHVDDTNSHKTGKKTEQKTSSVL